MSILQEFKNMDCMAEMVEFPDNYFDVAIVDPPYYSGPEKRKFYGRYDAREEYIWRIYTAG